jgi:hypothetical protein
MSDPPEAFGRTIQLFLVDGTPGGLIIASIHGWTGSVLVASQTTFGRLLARPEVDRTGLYILYGPDPQDPLGMRAYIGEADSVRERIDKSAGDRGFWETAIVVTTSDEALTKGHVRYLEARLIEMTKTAARVALDNGQEPSSERRRLPEADKANMEAFLASLKVILPVVGLDLLKPRPTITEATLVKTEEAPANEARFEIRHRSNVQALAIEADGEFVVLAGSQALKNTDYAKNSYATLKEELIGQGILVPTTGGHIYEFNKSYAFRSPSAAGSVILDRNTNGRTRWHVVGSKLTYHEWQEQKARSAGGAT